MKLLETKGIEMAKENEVTETTVVTPETPVVNETPETNETPTNETGNTTETPATPAKPKKWFEEEGAFPYEGGEIIQITANKHKGLIGRLAQVLKPSAKKDAVKAQLINAKDGSLQNTQVTLDMVGITLVMNKDNELVG